MRPLSAGSKETFSLNAGGSPLVPFSISNKVSLLPQISLPSPVSRSRTAAAGNRRISPTALPVSRHLQIQSLTGSGVGTRGLSVLPVTGLGAGAAPLYGLSFTLQESGHREVFASCGKQIIQHFLTLGREGFAVLERKAAGWLSTRIRPRTF